MERPTFDQILELLNDVNAEVGRGKYLDGDGRVRVRHLHHPTAAGVCTQGFLLCFTLHRLQRFWHTYRPVPVYVSAFYLRYKSGIPTNRAISGRVGPKHCVNIPIKLGKYGVYDFSTAIRIFSHARIESRAYILALPTVNGARRIVRS